MKRNYYSIKLNTKWVVWFESVEDHEYLSIDLYDITINKKSKLKIKEKNKLEGFFVEDMLSANEIPHFINQHLKLKIFPSSIYSNLEIGYYNIKEIFFDDETKLCLNIDRNDKEILNIKFRSPNDFIIV